MPLLRTLRFRLRALFRRDQLEREMDEEMRFHLEMETHEHAAGGIAAEEATRRAAIAFGGRERIREEMRDVRGWMWLDHALMDLRLAARTLAKSPGPTALAVAILAVGIAATATFFGLVNGLVRDPLPYPQSEQLASIWRKNIDSTLDYTPLTTADVLDLEERASAFAHLGAFSVRRFNLGGDRAQAVEGAMCTTGLFPALGMPPLHGRWFTPADELGDDTAVVLLSHALWQQSFGADPACVGRTVRLDGREHTIIGVMPEKFSVLSLWTRTRQLGIWTLLPIHRGPSHADGYWLGGLARLKPGVTHAQADEELKAIARILAQEDPDRSPRKTFWSTSLGLELGGLPALRVSMLLGAGWTLLVLAGQNVAGMMLARGIGRQPEIAVRLALGAQRLHIIRLVLMESLLVSLVAAGLGLVLTLWGQSTLSSILPAEILPRAGLHLDRPLLMSLVVLTLIATQMSGLAPALLASRTAVVGAIKDGSPSSTQTRKTQRKLRNLVVGQIALALLLVAVALQLSGTYRAMVASSRAQTSAHVMTAAIALKGEAYDAEAARLAVWDRLLERCGALPGVREAAVTTKLPFDGGVSSTVLIDDEAFEPGKSYPWIEESFVSEGFFASVGARLIQGRSFGKPDATNSRGQVVINRTMADRMWPAVDPIGRHIRPAARERWWTAEVVGVIEDLRQVVERPARPEMYYVFEAAPQPEAFLVLSMGPGIPAPADEVRHELRLIDPDLVMHNPRTLDELFRSQGRVLAIVTMVVDVFSVAIVVLAGVGIYGTLSFHFARRRREIGVRVALGAAPGDIVHLVIRQAMAWVLVGFGVGALGAWFMGSTLRRILGETGPFDVSGVALGALVVLLSALCAAWLPARRAMRIAPMAALRAE